MRTLKLFTAIFLCSLLFASCQKEDVPDPVTPNCEDSLKLGLWGYYNFDNGSFQDLSGKNHPMVGVNGAAFSYDMWGNSNNALELDGINDYAVIDSGKQFPEGDFTISFLMMPERTTGRIFQKANFQDAKGASFGFGFDQDFGSQNLHFYVGYDANICNGYTEPSNSTVLQVNKEIYPLAWYQVVLQHAGGVEKVFINGTLVATKSTPNPSFTNCTSAPFYLGMWWLEDQRPFGGKMDELRIYTRALSGQEIKYLYDRLPQVDL